MHFSRDDCNSLILRNFGYSVVCAKVIEKEDIITGEISILLEDPSGKVKVSIKEGQQIEQGDIAYFLFNCSDHPLTPERITVVPPELFPFAQLQLELFRERSK